MKNVIAILMVCAGLGLNANGNENLEIVFGLCFFFGSIQLAMPATHLLMAVSNIFFKPSRKTARSSR